MASVGLIIELTTTRQRNLLAISRQMFPLESQAVDIVRAYAFQTHAIIVLPLSAVKLIGDRDERGWTLESVQRRPWKTLLKIQKRESRLKWENAASPVVWIPIYQSETGQDKG